MDVELVAFEKIDGSGKVWVVPDRVKAIEPAPSNPSECLFLTLSGGHVWAVIGPVHEVADKINRHSSTDLVTGKRLPLRQTS